MVAFGPNPYALGDSQSQGPARWDFVRCTLPNAPAAAGQRVRHLDEAERHGTIDGRHLEHVPPLELGEQLLVRLHGAASSAAGRKTAGDDSVTSLRVSSCPRSSGGVRWTCTPARP